MGNAPCTYFWMQQLFRTVEEHLQAEGIVLVTELRMGEDRAGQMQTGKTETSHVTWFTPCLTDRKRGHLKATIKCPEKAM